MITTDQVERFREIISEIKEMMDEAKNIVRKGDRMTMERFRSYPYSHIVMALDEEHDFLGGDMFTLEDIADELESQAEDPEEDPDEDSDDSDNEEES